jgi:hypothetical protein
VSAILKLQVDKLALVGVMAYLVEAVAVLLELLPRLKAWPVLQTAAAAAVVVVRLLMFRAALGEALAGTLKNFLPRWQQPIPMQ